MRKSDRLGMRGRGRPVAENQRTSSFFTVVAEYMGGTYISQVHASDAHDAANRWARSASVRRRFGGSAFELGSPVAIKRAKNVWCVAGLGRATEKLVLVNIVKTSDE